MKRTMVLVIMAIFTCFVFSAFGASSGKTLDSRHGISKPSSQNHKIDNKYSSSQTSHSSKDNRSRDNHHDSNWSSNKNHDRNSRDWKSYDKYWSGYHPSLRPGNYHHDSKYSIQIHVPPIHIGTRSYRCTCSYGHPSHCRCDQCGYYKTYEIYVGQKKVISHYEYRTTQVWIPEQRISKPVKIGDFTVNVSTILVPGHHEEVMEKIPVYKYVSEYVPETRWISTKSRYCACRYHH